MGAMIAIASKKEENIAEKAVEMLAMLRQKNTRAFGLASPHTVKIEKSIENLQDQEMNSPIMVGHISSEISLSDEPQPKKLHEGAFVFNGRIYSPKTGHSELELVAEKLNQNRGNEEILIQDFEGCFAFAVVRSERLVAGRDSLGVCPLYWGENTDLAALASTRKALWKIGIIKVHSFPPGSKVTITKRGFKFRLVMALGEMATKPVTIQTAARRLKQLLTRSVEQRVSRGNRVAVAFSGGLDSSVVAFLAKKLEADVHLITVSLENKAEAEHAKDAAEALGLPLRLCFYNEKDVDEVLAKVLWLIEEANPIQVGIGIPIFWTASAASNMGLKVMLAGQGADELFGGYKRYLNSYSQFGIESVKKDILGDVERMGEINFERDIKICSFHNVELRLPFAARQLVEFATSLPLKLKIQSPNDFLRKRVLRRLAEDLKLPPFIVNKPKKAIQYTTGVNETIKRLSRRRGMSTREYLQKTFQTITKQNG